MFFLTIFIVNLFFIVTKSNSDSGYCDVNTRSCNDNKSNNDILLFYDVNPPEGFNLRRDVYMRFAIMLAEKIKNIKKNIKLVLPPWYRLYHWTSESLNSITVPLPWGKFFDIDSLKKFAPVVEMHDIFNKSEEFLQIDTLYMLENYDNMFDDGEFNEKWEINKADCPYYGNFWGYKNVTIKEIVCIRFQGKISNLWNVIAIHPQDKKIMFANAQIPLHDSYGMKSYWDCRRSMKFNKDLVAAAKQFIAKNFDCHTSKCDSYISVHWRRRDFEWANRVPTISSTVKQIDNAIKKNKFKMKKVFIASDGNQLSLSELESNMKRLGYRVYFNKPNNTELIKYKDGGIAIIDQIICAHSAYFIGTHESTFTYRIQEERQIIGFDTSTTFNRLCPDKGVCENPSIWPIVN